MISRSDSVLVRPTAFVALPDDERGFESLRDLNPTAIEEGEEEESDGSVG